MFSAESRCGRGLYFFQHRRFDEALADVRVSGRLDSPFTLGKALRKTFTQHFARSERAAEKDDACAINALGLCYGRGTGVERDDAEALAWYERAADAGHAEALCNICRCVRASIALRRKRSSSCFVALPTKESRCRLPSYSLCDWLVLRPWRVRLLPTASAVHAMYWLAHCCATGAATEQSAETAALWYRRAADAGHAGAMFQLALCFATGDGVASDQRKSLVWCRRASWANRTRCIDSNTVMAC